MIHPNVIKENPKSGNPRPSGAFWLKLAFGASLVSGILTGTAAVRTDGATKQMQAVIDVYKGPYDNASGEFQLETPASEGHGEVIRFVPGEPNEAIGSMQAAVNIERDDERTYEWMAGIAGAIAVVSGAGITMVIEKQQQEAA